MFPLRPGEAHTSEPIANTQLSAWYRIFTGSSTPKPWTYDESSCLIRKGGLVVCASVSTASDGRFIAAASEAVPKLLDEVSRLRAELRMEREGIE